MSDITKFVDKMKSKYNDFINALISEGQETRGGRLALIDQSFLRLNEFVQVVDYLNNELFNWFYKNLFGIIE